MLNTKIWLLIIILIIITALNKREINELLNLLQNLKELFDGTHINLKRDLVDFELKYNANPI